MLSKLTNQIKMQHSFENAALAGVLTFEPGHILLLEQLFLAQIYATAICY